MAAQPTRYQQIAEDLRRRIESREFTTDISLPSEVELQDQYRVSRNTVREAVKLLVKQHLLETRAGQGTFITKEIVPFVTTLSTDPKTGIGGGGEGANYPALIREQGREADAGIPNVTVLTCPPPVAARLGIEADADVVSRHQERYIDGTIWSVQTSYYPMRWVDQGATGLLKPKDIPEGAVQYIAEVLGLKQVGYRDLISARLPDDREQSLFNLTHNHTVIEVCRTSFAEDATPIRVTVTVFPADRNQIAYGIGVVPDHFEEPVQP
jgi:GntR family transcriptional regulator